MKNNFLFPLANHVFALLLEYLVVAVSIAQLKKRRKKSLNFLRYAFSKR